MPLVRVVSVAAMSNWRFPPDTYSTAMPLEGFPARRHGLGPNVSATSKTFLPDARGVMPPVKEHPFAEPANAPLVEILKITDEPWRSIMLHTPTISDKFAAVS